jgi:putative membrane protein
MDAVQRFFRENDLEAIRAAVAEAEGKTSGEIVPYVVDASDGYANAIWKGTALGALAGPLVAEALLRGGAPRWIPDPARHVFVLEFMNVAKSAEPSQRFHRMSRPSPPM